LKIKDVIPNSRVSGFSMPLGLALLLSINAMSTPQRRHSWPAWQRRRVALDRCFVRDEFRIYYTFKGQDMLPESDRVDTDGDGTPDRIQNIARQLVAARRMYGEVMGLRHPLEGARYKGRVQSIDVHVWGLATNGSAGDAVVNYHRPTDPPSGVNVVTIDLSRDLPTRNLTPAHELFHVFQNGYTLFKTSWYTEGTARWSEWAFREGDGPTGPLPDTHEELARVFKLKYDASRFWAAIGRQIDPVGRLTIPDDLRQLCYLGDDRPIVEDDVFYGAAFLRRFLDELDRIDDIASQCRGLDPAGWRDAEQKSAANNPYIWAGVVNVCREFEVRSPALQRMAQALRAEAIADALQ